MLVDGLDIYKSQLAADGKLSPGDYKLLIAKAQSVYANPGLTPANRSAIELRMADWKSAATVSTLNDNQSITRLNNEVKDTGHMNSMFLGNNPAKYLQAQAATQHAKITQLADAINQLDNSGQDSSAHLNEYNTALSEYQDTLSALETVKNHVAGAAPTSDQVAYVTTNGKGEITDVNVGREGSQSGYLETNGLYGGLKIYGKLNQKQDGKNVFLLGNKTFSAPDVVIPGPDGSLKASTLIDTAQQKGKPGIFTSATAGYSDVTPDTMHTQSAIPVGSYGKGSNGFLYKKESDGSYTKYVNADPKKMGIEDNNIVSLPNQIEQSISQQAKTTVDASTVQPTMPAPTAFAPSTPAATPVAAPAGPAPAAGHPTASAPTASAPTGFMGIAAGAMKSAGSFLGNLFGGGK